MAFSSSTIEVPLAVQRARESEAERFERYLQYGLNETQVNDQMEMEEERAELDTCWSWCVCIGALLVNTFLVGIHHAYGVLFIAIRQEFNISFETASWMGSISYGLTAMMGPLAGLVFHKIGHRACATLGTFIAVGGLVGCSFARDVLELSIAYIGLFGFGCSLAYTPSVVVCNAYFDRHIGMATGIQMSGTTIGGIILPPIFQVLVTSVGFHATMRVLAGIACLGFVGASTFTGRQEAHATNTARAEPVQSGHHQYQARVKILLRDPAFVLWLSVMCVVHLGAMTPNVHIVARGLDVGLTMSEASSIVSVFSVASALSRIGFGRVLDQPRVSLRLMAQLSIGVMGLSLMLVPAAVNLPLMLTFALVFGCMEGLFVDLIPLYTLRLVGPQGASVGWGLIVGACSVPWIVGPYLAGLMRGSIGSYDLAFVLCGAVIIVGAAMVFAMPLCLRKRKRAQGSLQNTGEGESLQLTLQNVDTANPGIGPIFGYISIQDMPASYRQQIRFRPGKTQQLRKTPVLLASSTAQTLSNLEIAPTPAETAHQQRTSSRSQEVVSQLAPFEYDSLAALRRKLGQPATQAALQSAASSSEPSSLRTPPEPEAGVPASGQAAPGAGQTVPLPAGYEAVPVAGYLVLTPGSDQARFVVVDSRAGQALTLRTSLASGADNPADESDAELRQMLDTIVEESRSNIAVVDGGDVAHERFTQVRAAVTGWHAHQEVDETDDVASFAEPRSTETRSVELVGEPVDAERVTLSRSCDDVAHLNAGGSPGQLSVSPSDITLSEVAGSQEWHEPRPGSALSDRARSAGTRSRRRSGSRSDAGSVSSAEEVVVGGLAEHGNAQRPYY